MKNLRVSIFCGSSCGNSQRFMEEARGLGVALATCGLPVFYGGGRSGMMGAFADGYLSIGTNIVGIIPENEQEEPHLSIQEIRWVDSIDTRKKMLLDNGDVVIALPGGLGTMDELFYCLARMRLGHFHGACLIYNIDGFFNEFEDLIDRLISKGFAKKKHLSNLRMVFSVLDIIQQLNLQMGPDSN